MHIASGNSYKQGVRVLGESTCDLNKAERGFLTRWRCTETSTIWQGSCVSCTWKAIFAGAVKAPRPRFSLICQQLCTHSLQLHRAPTHTCLFIGTDTIKHAGRWSFRLLVTVYRATMCQNQDPRSLHISTYVFFFKWGTIESNVLLSTAKYYYEIH